MLSNLYSSIKVYIEKYKVIISNFSYLSILHGVNLFIPLLSYPYLIRVLGKETYGLVIFAQATINYLVIFVGFGFNITGTKEISNNINDKIKLNQIVSSIYIIKGLFVAVSFIVLLILFNLMPKAQEYKVLFTLCMWACIYEWLLPLWYFQGIEKMKYITLLTLVSRITFLILIFVLINQPEDFLRVPMINGIGALISAIIALYILFYKHGIKFNWQSYSVLKNYTKQSFPVFISGISVQIYVLTNKIIIGGKLGMTEVAYYDLAEKIVNILKKPQMIISQAIFPKTSRGKSKNLVKKMMFLSFGGGVILFILLQIFAPYIVLLLGGKQMMGSVILLRVLALAVPIVYASQYTIVHSLLANGFNKVWMNIVSASAAIYLIAVLSIIKIDLASSMNFIIITLLSELFILIVTFYYSKNYKLI